MKESEDSFKYTYSSREHGEIESIVKKYLPPEENGIQRLRNLDRKVTKKASAAGITAGVIGLLLLGLGMSCVTVWQNTLFAAGVVIGILGIALSSAAHPIYNAVLRREREKAAPEILRLADEIKNNGADHSDKD